MVEVSLDVCYNIKYENGNYALRLRKEEESS